LSRNFGHQAALTAGLEHSRGDAVVTLDSDLQHPPALIPELVARWRDRFDVVLTIRSDDGRLSWFKRTSSRLFYRILAMCSNLDVRASASDFRLMSRPAVDALLKLKESHRYVRGMVQWLGFRVAEVPFTPDARKAGISKYTLRRMVRFALDGLLSFSPAPIRVTVGAGLALGFLTWILCIGLAFVSLSRTDPTTYLVAAGITAVHFLGAFLLAALGVIGEYVYRIYEQVKGRPVYIVKETTTNTSNVSLTATRSPAKAA
jgi:dolichol-phosphate mannosyltransferase